MKIRSLLAATILFTIAAAAAWAGQTPAGLVFLQAPNLEEALSTAREGGMPVLFKLEDGIVVGGGRRDALKAAARVKQAMYLGDIGPKSVFLVTGKSPLKRDDVSKLGAILLESGNAFLVRADDGIDGKILPFGAMAIPLPERPLPNHQTPKYSGKGLTYDPAIAALVAQVDTGSIRGYLLRLQAFGSRGAHSANRFAVAESLKQWFLGMGIADVKLDTFYIDGGATIEFNVVATIPGTVDTGSAIIVDGHCDDVPGPGVDDNGTGTVAALEMARLLAANPPARTVKCIGFAAEETGLDGSFHYSEEAYLSGARIYGVFNYDMIGHYENTNTYRVSRYTGAEYLGDALGQATLLYTYLNPYYVAGGYGSDSYAFWAYGIPATWGFEQIFSTVYHTTHDSITYVSVPYCAEVIRAGLAAVASVAKMPDVVRGISVSDVGDGQRLFVSWLPNSDNNITGYHICYGRQSGAYADTIFTAGTSDTIEGLMSDSLYYVTVLAENNSGYVSLSAFEATGTPRSAPAAPAGLSATPVTSGIALSWRSNTELDLAGYRLYRAVDDTTAYDSLNTALLSDTSYTDSPLSGDHRYYYKVRAFDLDGNAGGLSPKVLGRPLTLDQGVLIVDETFNATTGAMPRDTAQDQFYDYILAGYRHEQYEFGSEAERPLLCDLAPYSTVLWHGDDYSQMMASGSVADLRRYLDWGGNLWFSGWKPAGNLRSNAAYPASFPDTSFLAQYLKVGGANLSGITDSFSMASGELGYFSIAVDPAKVPVPSWAGAMRYIESYSPASGGQAIYTMDMLNNSSPFEGLPCGVRHLGSSYKTVILGFPMYFMDRDQARLAAQQIMADFGETGVDGGPSTPFGDRRLTMEPCAPNPFHGSTLIRYNLAQSDRVSLRIYNVAGQAVRTLVSRLQPAGAHSVRWDGRDDRGRMMPGGVYFARLATTQGHRTAKITMLK